MCVRACAPHVYVCMYTHTTHNIDQPAHLALAVLLVSVVGVEEREVVPVHVRKLRLGWFVLVLCTCVCVCLEGGEWRWVRVRLRESVCFCLLFFS